MANNKNSMMLWALIIIGAGLAVYFLFFANAQCKVDKDCGTGKTCSMDHKCVVPAISTESPPDGKCPSNTIPLGLADPDCPLYCPEGGRTGYSGFCCINVDNTAAIDCSTGTELNPDAWNNLQAFITFGPSGGSSTTKTMSNVANIVGWTAPSTFPSGVTQLKLWLESVTTNPSSTVWSTAWVDSNCIKSGSTVAGCFGKEDAFTVIPSQAGSWRAAPLAMDSMADGTYTVTYKYCAQDSAGTVIIVPICDEIIYTIKKTGENLGFTVSASLG